MERRRSTQSLDCHVSSLSFQNEVDQSSTTTKALTISELLAIEAI